MKTLKLTLVALLVSAATFSQTKDVKAATKTVTPKTTPAPVPTKKSNINWDTTTHDFGQIEKGKPVSYEFSFTNTTDQTIMLTKVKPSCGCTATNYTKTPIKPGEKGTVMATYNAAASSKFTKTVQVTTNEEGTGPTVLMIKGEVLKPATEEKSILMK